MTFGLGADVLVGNGIKLAGDYQYDTDFLGAPWHRYKLRLESRF